MIRGTTSEFTIEIEGLSRMEYTDLVMIIQSGGVIEKHLRDLTVDGDSVAYKLTQAESLSLKHHHGTLELIIINGDERYSSGQSTFTTEPTLKNEVIS